MHETQQSLHATIGVLTFHRPEQIVQTVEMLHQQLSALQAPWSGEVLVVDNDPAGSGCDAVEAMGLDRVRFVVEPTPGIAAARNRALDEAQSSAGRQDGVEGGSDVLLFLDDDGRPGPGWLQLMLDCWLASRPAVVAGFVDTRYPGEVDPWIHAGGFFTRRRWESGRELPAAACGNLLLDLHQLGARRFSTGLGMGGGEDTLLTRQIVAAGGRIVACPEAVVVDLVTTDRMTRQWVLLRSLSHGNTHGVLTLMLAGDRLARPKLLAGGLGRMVAGGGRSLLGRARHDLTHQARGSRAAARGAGMVLAAAGLRYQEYVRDGGWRERLAPIPDDLRPQSAHRKESSR